MPRERTSGHRRTTRLALQLAAERETKTEGLRERESAKTMEVRSATMLETLSVPQSGNWSVVRSAMLTEIQWVLRSEWL